MTVVPTGLASWVPRDPALTSLLRNAGLKVEKAVLGDSGHRFLLFSSDLDSSAQLASQGLLKLDCAENIQHAFQVVDHRGQTDLGLSASHAAEQETRMSEDAVL